MYLSIESLVDGRPYGNPTQAYAWGPDMTCLTRVSDRQKVEIPVSSAFADDRLRH